MILELRRHNLHSRRHSLTQKSGGPGWMDMEPPGKKPWVFIFSWFVKLFSLSIVKADLVSEVLTMEPRHITAGGRNLSKLFPA